MKSFGFGSSGGFSRWCRRSYLHSFPKRKIVKPYILYAILICLLLFGSASAETDTMSDSTKSAPSKVHHRSTEETLLALPGMIVYLPFHLFFGTVEYTAKAIYDERVLDRFKALLTTADGRIGIRPLSGTADGTGLRVFYKDFIFHSDASHTSSFGMSAQQRQHHIFTLSWPQGRALPGDFIFEAGFQKEPTEPFYGIGHHTVVTDETNFLQEKISARLAYQHPLGHAFGFDTEVNYRAVDIREGKSDDAPTTQSQYTLQELHGLDEQVHYIESATSLLARFVDVPGSPTRGNLSRLRFVYTLGDDEFSHVSMLAVTEQFFELFYRRTLSFRAGTEWRSAPGTDKIPFYNLASLGGNVLLRGYPRGRFRDRGTAFATATYKFPVWELLEGALFYEAGRTFQEINDLTFSDWKSAYGGGLRIWVPDGLVFEQVIARSSEGTRLIFNFKTLF